MPLASGTQIGSFTVLSLLGKGGMGEVYRARDAKLGREVALKMLPAGLLRDTEHGARFSREARLLASLDHPNIGAIYGLEDADGVRALVLALVEGPTLADLLKSGSLPVEQASAIARQIAEAVEYAHDRGVIHRDLKPANVKITPEGVVKVLDFGLAKALIEEPSGSAGPEALTLTMGATQDGTVMGTAAYMPPEQAKGLKIDRRGDVWGFGVVFYEMLTGKRLFTGQTIGDVLASVIKEEKDLSAVPDAYRPLITRCIQKDPRRRLQAIGEARLVLEAGGESPSVAPPSVIPPRRASFAWATAGLLAIVAGLALWAPWRAAPPSHGPYLRLSVDLGPNALVGTNITAAISPDGRRVVYPAKGSGGQPQLALRLLDQPGETMLPGTEGGTEPFFSPNSQWVAFFSGGKLKKISVQGGAAVTLADAPNARGGTWSDDRTIVAALNNISGLELVSSDGGGTPRMVTRLEGGEATHRWPHALPGGEAVLFTNSADIDNYGESTIEVVILKTGQRKKVWQGGYFARYAPALAARGHLLFLREDALFGVSFDPTDFEVRGTPVPLFSGVGNNFSTGGGQYDVAPGAGMLSYWSGKGIRGWQISWLEKTGLERTELDAAAKIMPLVAQTYEYISPRFSHDGTRLAVAGPESDIYVSDWVRGTFTRITFDSQGSSTNPVWTPDDKYIAFRENSGKGPKIGWVRASGGESTILRESANNMRPTDFSKDGTRLIYAERSPETEYDLWILPLDLSDPEHPKPGKPELFLGTTRSEREAAFSPDGRWVAYCVNENGRDEIYVRPFPAAGRAATGGPWQVSNSGGSNPRWSSNGRELFYKSPAPDHRIMVAEYGIQGDAFVPGKTRLWADALVIENGYATYDVHPDGKRLAIFPEPPTSQESGNVHLTFLVNFFDELRRQVPLE